MRPGPRLDLFVEAGLTLVRDGRRDWFDPASGRLDRAAIATLRRDWAPFIEAGAKIALVTPSPVDVPGAGDPDSGWLEAWREACRVAAAELGDIVGMWQIGNELNLWYFRRPLSLDDAVAFAMAGAEGVLAGDPGADVGINPCCRDEAAKVLFLACYGPEASVRLTHVGVDLYPGSFLPGGPEDLRDGLREVAELVPDDRPIVLHEMGYSSKGGVFEPPEAWRYLASLGYASVDEVRARPDAFAEAVGPMLAGSLLTVPESDFEDELLDICQHVFKKWRFTWPGHVHDEETQAAYFEQGLDIVLAEPRIGGILVFAWTDYPAGVRYCYRCGATDCPIETAFGLLDGDERPKPAYRAVRDALRRHGIHGPS